MQNNFWNKTKTLWVKQSWAEQSGVELIKIVEHFVFFIRNNEFQTISFSQTTQQQHSMTKYCLPTKIIKRKKKYSLN